MHVLILGTRGIPSRHSGFETFAQDFALYLRSRNHDVTVYCQVEKDVPAHEDEWNGVRRVLIPAADGSAGSLRFCMERSIYPSVCYTSRNTNRLEQSRYIFFR